MLIIPLECPIMVNLKQLRVVELKELAKECDIKLKMKLKADIIQEIKGAGINDDYLESLVSKYKKSKPVSKKTTTTSTTKIETRINSLEKQVKFLMEKFNDIEYHLSMKAGVSRSSEHSSHSVSVYYRGGQKSDRIIPRKNR